MNRSVTYTQSVMALFLVSGFSCVAAAQDAGTNVPTQPTTQTPSALQPQSLTMELAPGPPAVLAPSNEPVIDAATTRKTLPNRPLLVTGFLVLGLSYSGAAIVGAISDRDADKKLYYPVVGPWLDINHRGCADDPCSNNQVNRWLIGGDGVIQAIGAASMLLSLVVPEKTTRNWYLIGNNKVIVAPQIASTSMGLSAAGVF